MALSDKPLRGKEKRYVLERTLPDGSLKRSEPVNLLGAERHLMQVLHYNVGLAKKVAGRIAVQLADRPVGAYVESHGYRFRLLSASKVGTP